MSGCDAFYDIAYSFNYAPNIFSNHPCYEYAPTECTAVGFSNQFLALMSPLFHMLIAISLLYLLFGYKLDNIIHYRYYIFIFILFFSLFIAIIPLFFPNNKNHYQTFNNYQNKTNTVFDCECWIKDSILQFVLLFVPIIISLCLHYLTLIILCVKWKQAWKYAFKFKILIQKLIPWVIIFSLLLMFPIIYRVWTFINSFENNSRAKNYKIPLFFVFLHHWSRASVGIGNGIVWYYNRRSDKSLTIQLNSRLSQYATGGTQPNVVNPKHFTNSITGRAGTFSKYINGGTTTPAIGGGGIMENGGGGGSLKLNENNLKYSHVGAHSLESVNDSSKIDSSI